MVIFFINKYLLIKSLLSSSNYHNSLQYRSTDIDFNKLGSKPEDNFIADLVEVNKTKITVALGIGRITEFVDLGVIVIAFALAIYFIILDFIKSIGT